MSISVNKNLNNIQVSRIRLNRNVILIAISSLMILGLVFYFLYDEKEIPKQDEAAWSCPSTSCVNHLRRVVISPTSYYCKGC